GTWIHFDAKYRVDTVAQLFGVVEGIEPGAVNEADESDVFGDAEDTRTGRPLRADLLKMHAYKDAIRRSSGAYIIYPGIEEERNLEYHEILPGLGAFPLRPTKEGVADGTSILTSFIEDVVMHVASQVTQHERQRYWVAEAHRGEPPAQPAWAADFLTRP